MNSLEQLEKSSRRNAWLTLYGVLIIIASLIYSGLKLADLDRNILEKRMELDEYGSTIASLEIERKEYINQLEQSKVALSNLRNTQDSILNFLVSITDQTRVHILDRSVDWDEVKRQISNLPAGQRKNAILNSLLLAWKDIPFAMGQSEVNSGFDSPRFLNYVLGTVGSKVKRKNNQRMSDALMKNFEKVNNPKIGDLVFFKGQIGSFGFILLSVGKSDSEHVGVGTMQKTESLQIISMGNINTPHFPLLGYFRVIYPNEKL
jgi:cell wall-associated NlpC family hydrolase